MVSVDGESVLETARGPLTVRRRCPVELIESLTVDEGFGNILRPSRAKETFRRLASSPDGNVTLAFTADGLIAGYVLINRPSPVRWQQRVSHERWEQCEAIHELGSIEVSKNFRSLGIAERLMQVALADPAYVDAIVVAEGIRWHWDLSTAGGNAFVYRERLLALMKRHGFEEFGTDEPDVRSDSANALVARIGPACASEHTQHFHALRYVSRRVATPDVRAADGRIEHIGATDSGGGGMTAGGRMTPDPLTAAPADSLQRARERMQSRRVRHLPVMEDGKLVGIVTDRDIRETMPSPQIIAEADEARSFLTMVTVGEVMKRDVVTVAPDTAIERATRLFLERRIGCLPVMDGDALVGILTQTDMLKALADVLADSEGHNGPESLD
jgi:CBS domain-containing protein